MGIVEVITAVLAVAVAVDTGVLDKTDSDDTYTTDKNHTSNCGQIIIIMNIITDYMQEHSYI